MLISFISSILLSEKDTHFSLLYVERQQNKSHLYSSLNYIDFLGSKDEFQRELPDLGTTAAVQPCGSEAAFLTEWLLVWGERKRDELLNHLQTLTFLPLASVSPGVTRLASWNHLYKCLDIQTIYVKTKGWTLQILVH